MSRTNQMIEEMNYRNDPRVRALEDDNGLEFDEKAMTLTWMRCIEDDERDDPAIQALGDVDERPVVFSAKYEVCDLCGGRGTHVNPSIDAGGIGEDDEFWEDDQDWDEDDDGNEVSVSRYARGDYDVACYACKGKRVIPVIADTEGADYDAYTKFMDDKAELESMYAAERRWGA